MSTQPLAQTFKIDTQDGCFLTSVDLFFYAKDSATPVWIEIRNTVAGAPGVQVLPHSRKVLEPNSINTDTAEGITPTRFTFDSPVFVQEAQECAIVLMTKSTEYRVWTAEMGQVDIQTGEVIATQPALGVLYKSSIEFLLSIIKSDASGVSNSISQPTTLRVLPSSYSL